MSSKSVAQKLHIKENYRVLLLNEPLNYWSILGELPSNVSVFTELIEPVDLIQVFVTLKKELEEQLNKLKTFVGPNVFLWITYPKGTSKFKADINRDSINDYAQSIGLTGIAMISVDETWSALRLKIIR